MESIELKSELFKHFDTSERGNEGFTKDLKQLLRIWKNEPKRALFCKKLPSILLTQTNFEERDAMDKLSGEISELPTVLQDAVNCVNFILSHLVSKKGRADKPSNLANDMIALRLVEEPAEIVTKLMEWLKNDLSPKVEPELRSRGAASGLFPSLKGISIDVELRGVQVDKYDSTQKIEEYKPNITGIVPVASIEIRTSDDDFVFQGDKDDIAIMINHLRAGLKDLEALEKIIKDRK